jgi:hypothetical protein
VGKQTYIYGLLCPRENKIRYVGKTDYPDERYKVHLSEARRGRWPKDFWIQGLRARNLKPRLIILERLAVCNSDTTYCTLSKNAEFYWIRRLLKEGHPLTNLITKPEQQILNVRRLANALNVSTERLVLGEDA